MHFYYALRNLYFISSKFYTITLIPSISNLSIILFFIYFLSLSSLTAKNIENPFFNLYFFFFSSFFSSYFFPFAFFLSTFFYPFFWLSSYSFFIYFLLVCWLYFLFAYCFYSSLLTIIYTLRFISPGSLNKFASRVVTASIIAAS